MPERRMAKIMNKRQSFGVVFVELQRGCNRSSYLRNFNGVRETVSEMVAQSGGKDLRLAFHAAKRTAVNDAVAVPLEIIAVGMWRFRIATTSRISGIQAQSTQH
jgi:hypothetical protein